MKKKFILFAISLAFLMGGCTSKHIITFDNNNNNKIERTDYIVFLNFEMEHDSISNKNTVEFLDKSIVEGKFKRKQETARFIPFLTIRQYERDSLSYETTMNHPLVNHVEYVNEKGELGYQIIRLNKAEFSMRLQIKQGETSLKIFENLTNEQVDLLYEIIL